MKLALAALAAVLLAAGCGSVTVPAGPSPARILSPPPPPAASPSWPPGWTLPDRSLTPGSVAGGGTLAQLCPHVDPALEAARPGSAETRQVYARYGIVSHSPGAYEVDHLVPIELGGSPGALANLWPEPDVPADPAMIRAEHLNAAFVHNPKDALETVLHRDVCAGTVPLAVAQRAIAADWRAAYETYIGRP